MICNYMVLSIPCNNNNFQAMNAYSCILRAPEPLSDQQI